MRRGSSEEERARAITVWNVNDNSRRPHTPQMIGTNLTPQHERRDDLPPLPAKDAR
ncbi:hypothetical protein ABZ499_30130 [Streptomyces sp. NPDC019990]|uniref:hypothetical protein n=1 Tax=Streptomyces sp. NPDC019990 TaxID=3154693 RepID=UPI0033E2DF54